MTNYGLDIRKFFIGEYLIKPQLNNIFLEYRVFYQGELFYTLIFDIEDDDLWIVLSEYRGNLKRLFKEYSSIINEYYECGGNSNLMIRSRKREEPVAFVIRG